MHNNAEPVLVWRDNTVKVGLPALRSFLTDLYSRDVYKAGDPTLYYPAKGRLQIMWERPTRVTKNIGGGRVEYTIGLFHRGEEDDSKALLYVTVRV